MTPVSQGSRICVFCYRNNTTTTKKLDSLIQRGHVEPVIKENDQLTEDVEGIQKFIKLVSRFVECGRKSSVATMETLSSLLSSGSLKCLGCCEDCRVTVDSFCEVYHQVKCLELQLEWKLDTLVRVMKLASKESSRKVSLNKALEGNGLKETSHKQLKIIDNFRFDLIKTCRRKLAKSQPRILLERTEPESTTTVQFPSHVVNQNLVNIIDAKEVPSSAPAHAIRRSDGQNEEDEDRYVETIEVANDFGTALADVETGGNLLSDTDNYDDDFHSSIFDDNNQNQDDSLIETKLEFPTGIHDAVSTAAEDNETVQQTAAAATDENVSNVPPGNKSCIDDSGHLNSTDAPNTRLKRAHVSPEKSQEQLELETEREHAIEEPDNQDNNSSPTPQRYSFRPKRRKTFSNLDENEDEDNSDNEKSSIKNDSQHSDSDIPNSSDDDYDDQANTPLKRKTTKQNKVKLWCTHCGTCYSNELAQQQHLQLHSAVGTFPCNFCDKVDTDVIELSRHERKNHSSTSNKPNKGGPRHAWSCPRCSFKGIYASNYQVHFAHAHFGIGELVPDDEKVECEICKIKIFVFSKNHHAATFHDTSGMEPTQIRNCAVEGCSAYFRTTEQLKAHERVVHNDIAKLNTPTIAPAPDNQKKFARSTRPFSSLPEGKYKCNFCSVVKTHASKLALHEAKHATELEDDCDDSSKQYIFCPRCSYKCSKTSRGSLSYITHHLKTHLGIISADCEDACTMCSGGSLYIRNTLKHYQKFHNTEGMDPSELQRCEECPAYFTTALHLQRHIVRKHQQDNRCKKCDKTFNSRDKLNQHINCVHKLADEDPNLPIPCDHPGCKKRFATQGEVEFHKTFSHRKYKPKMRLATTTTCPKCGKLFGKRNRMLCHMNEVHGDRKFVCTECGKSFKSKQSLDVHMVYHKDPDAWKFQCATCGKKCTTNQKLKEHMGTHTKDKPWVCQFCGANYAHRHNWRKHLTTNHADEEGVEEIVKKTRISLT